MHNTHYAIITADDIDDAINEVEHELDNWGDENNWYSIVDTIELSNDMPADQRAKVQGELDYLNKEVSPDKMQQIIEQIDDQQQALSDGNRCHYYFLSELYKQLYELSAHAKTVPAFTIEDIIKGEFNGYNEYRYDEYGLTNLTYRFEEGIKLFFVIVDMHS